MKARHIGYAIGAASVAAGVIDLVVRRRRIARTPAPLATAFAAPPVIAPPVIADRSGPVWTRFAADVTDLGTLAVAAARSDGQKRGQALTAFALVALVATADYLAARAVQRRSLGLA
ncbi:hypothetical protein [Sphingomonas sanxanigenens]|nr:hypothetical protein [Sphingomonas sanxanigenens]